MDLWTSLSFRPSGLRLFFPHSLLFPLTIHLYIVELKFIDNYCLAGCSNVFLMIYLCTEYIPSTLPLWRVPYMYLICTYVIIKVYEWIWITFSNKTTMCLEGLCVYVVRFILLHLTMQTKTPHAPVSMLHINIIYY